MGVRERKKRQKKKTRYGENIENTIMRAGTSNFLRRTIYLTNNYITCDDLEKRLNDSDNKNHPLVLDARRPDEYKHSHIKFSINVYAMKSIPRIMNELVPQDREIVVYCAVGLRSGWLTQRLAKKHGFVNAMTLRGGFYKWANEGRPMYNKYKKRVRTVMPQHKLASILLNSEIKFKKNQTQQDIEHIEDDLRRKEHAEMKKYYKQNGISSALETREELEQLLQGDLDYSNYKEDQPCEERVCEQISHDELHRTGHIKS
ncbi:hypothetical protein AKO1_002588 [Acrasis kona]|uniref:Rhodanese domain-containing protein n=1 Tax=Acrasis kona TaxID=1008807 RepID=A0AAW2YMU0_9EUKA